MAGFYLCPISTIFQYFNDTGIVLAGGQIYTYVAGTSTPAPTWTDNTGATLNSNPIVLASNGRLNNVQIWQFSPMKLKIIVKDSSGNQIGPVFDWLAGINDPADIIAGNANTFVATFNGFTTSLTGTINYQINGSLVSMWTRSGITGASNATTMGFTGLPSEVTPAGPREILCHRLIDNGTQFYSAVFRVQQFSGVGSVDFSLLESSGGFVGKFSPSGNFTASGTKGISDSWHVIYNL